MDVLGVVVHDDSHAVHVEAVGLGHHALSEAVGDVVGAEEGGEHDADLGRDDGEHDGVPPLEDGLLPLDVRALASGQDAAGVARLAAGRFYEGVEVPAALQLVLDAQTAVDADDLTPLGVDLAFQVERAFLVRDVAGRDEEGEDDPEEEGVDGEERAVVEEDAGPADEGREDAERGGDGGDDQLGAVADADDVGVGPDVEPDEEAGDEACERVRGELCENNERRRSRRRTRGRLTTALQRKRIHLNRFHRPPGRVFPPSLPPNQPDETPS